MNIRSTMAAKITGATLICIVIVAIVVCSSGVSYGTTLEDECKEVVETGIGKCFGYIMGKENPAPRECCSQVAGVMSTKIACLCLSIKGAFEDDQTGGVSFYNALQIGNSCKIDGLDPTNCIGRFLFHYSMIDLAIS